jgi:hypothetical protein
MMNGSLKLLLTLVRYDQLFRDVRFVIGYSDQVDATWQIAYLISSYSTHAIGQIVFQNGSSAQVLYAQAGAQAKLLAELHL